MLWPLSVVLVANTNGRLAIPALAGLLVLILLSVHYIVLPMQITRTLFSEVTLLFNMGKLVMYGRFRPVKKLAVMHKVI